jgi:hypothetical protein
MEKDHKTITVERPTGPRITASDPKSIGQLVSIRARNVSKSVVSSAATIAVAAFAVLTKHKFLTGIGSTVAMTAATHFIISTMMMGIIVNPPSGGGGGGTLTLINTENSNTIQDPAVVTSNVQTIDCGGSCSIGAAAATRRVVYTYCYRIAAGGASGPNTVSINVGGGGAVSMGSPVASGSSGGIFCGVYIIAQATGTTAVFTHDFVALPNPTESVGAVYSLTNSTAGNDDPSSGLTGSSGPSATKNHATYVVVAAGIGDFNIASSTVTNLSKDTDHNIGSSVQYTVASQTVIQSTSLVYSITWNTTVNVASCGFVLAFQP